MPVVPITYNQIWKWGCREKYNKMKVWNTYIGTVTTGPRNISAAAVKSAESITRVCFTFTDC